MRSPRHAAPRGLKTPVVIFLFIHLFIYYTRHTVHGACATINKRSRNRMIFNTKNSSQRQGRPSLESHASHVWYAQL